MARPSDLGEYYKQLFTGGQGTVTARPGMYQIKSPRPYYHPGYDIGVGQGTAVKIPYSGRVISSGQRGRYGQSMQVEIPELKSTFNLGHLSNVVLPRGEFTAGQPIAYTGGTPGTYGSGVSTGAHIDIERASGPVNFQQMLKGIVNTASNIVRGIPTQVSRSLPKINFQDIVKKAQQQFGNRLAAVGRNKAQVEAFARGSGKPFKLVRISR